MGDEDRRDPSMQALNGCCERLLCDVIERGGSFVENQNCGTTVESPRHRDALPLPS